MIWRAEVPAARRLRSGRVVRERRAWEVVRVSTSVVVGRSHVLSVWSHEAEYATVGSVGANATEETGAECDLIKASGPRCGVELDVDNFRRLEIRALLWGSRVNVAAGASDFLLDQIPTAWSAEAESMRVDGLWTAMESTLALCP